MKTTGYFLAVLICGWVIIGHTGPKKKLSIERDSLELHQFETNEMEQSDKELDSLVNMIEANHYYLNYQIKQIP
jgi:hypothetical protein